MISLDSKIKNHADNLYGSADAYIINTKTGITLHNVEPLFDTVSLTSFETASFHRFKYNLLPNVKQNINCRIIHIV